MVDPGFDELAAILVAGGMVPDDRTITLLKNGIIRIIHRHHQRPVEANALRNIIYDDQVFKTVAKAARAILTALEVGELGSAEVTLLAFNSQLRNDLEAVQRLRAAAVDARKMIRIRKFQENSRKTSTLLYLDLLDIYSQLRIGQNLSAAIGGDGGSSGKPGPCYRFYKTATKIIDPEFPIADPVAWRGVLMSAKKSTSDVAEIVYFDEDGGAR